MVKTTIIVGAAVAFAAFVGTFSASEASTPVIRTTYQGLDARGWHQAAERWMRAAQQRAIDRDWLQKRLALRVIQVRDLRRAKAAPARDVQYAIRLAAVTYGVPESELHRVASCESGHSSTAINGQYRGVFQEGPMFERGRYGRAGFSVWDPVANALTAAEVVSNEGWSQWTCKP